MMATVVELMMTTLVKVMMVIVVEVMMTTLRKGDDNTDEGNCGDDGDAIAVDENGSKNVRRAIWIEACFCFGLYYFQTSLINDGKSRLEIIVFSLRCQLLLAKHVLSRSI